MIKKVPNFTVAHVILMAFFTTQALVACGTVDADGYDERDYQLGFIEDASESASSAELRDGDARRSESRCAAQGFDSSGKTVEVSALWNEYLEEMIDHRQGLRLGSVISGFEELYCDLEVPNKVWVDGGPLCSLITVPVSDGRNFALRADQIHNPALMQYSGCVLRRTAPQAAR